MRIAIPREVKTSEHRVALIPDHVQQLVAAGHQVAVQSDAGAAIGYTDDLYRAAGADIIQGAEQLHNDAELIVKVKEPQDAEFPLYRADQTLFCYLHLAASEPLTRALQNTGIRCLAFETVTNAQGQLPLLGPMSEIAGKLCVQQAVQFMLNHNHGLGVLPGGARGAPPALIGVLGAGVVGSNAALIALGLGARVFVLDINPDQLARLRNLCPQEYLPRLTTISFRDPETHSDLLGDADILVGAALKAGAKAPVLINEQQLSLFKPGAILADVAIDQGGCFASSRPTTHAEPVFSHRGIRHYCVANIPGAAARTASQALSSAILPAVQALADKGVERALEDDLHLAAGLNIEGGELMHPAVRELFAG